VKFVFFTEFPPNLTFSFKQLFFTENDLKAALLQVGVERWFDLMVMVE